MNRIEGGGGSHPVTGLGQENPRAEGAQRQGRGLGRIFRPLQRLGRGFLGIFNRSNAARAPASVAVPFAPGVGPSQGVAPISAGEQKFKEATGLDNPHEALSSICSATGSYYTVNNLRNAPGFAQINKGTLGTNDPGELKEGDYVIIVNKKLNSVGSNVNPRDISVHAGVFYGKPELDESGSGYRVNLHDALTVEGRNRQVVKDANETTASLSIDASGLRPGVFSEVYVFRSQD